MSDRVELAVRELVAALRAEMAPAEEPPALVDITTAARTLGISRTSLYGLLDSGTLASRHVGRRRLIPRVSLDAYVVAGPAFEVPSPAGKEASDAAARLTI